MTGLGELPGGTSFAIVWGVSADESVIVGRGTSAAGVEALIWDQTNGTRNLKMVLGLWPKSDWLVLE